MEQILSQSARSFASDNNAGVHPEILAALARANQGHVVPTEPIPTLALRLKSSKNILALTSQSFSLSTEPAPMFWYSRL